MPLYLKKIRLAPENYLGRRIYFVTICCAQRRPIFAAKARGQRVVERLIESGTKLEFTIHAYCAMPDRLHVVAQGAGQTADLVKFVNNFKQRTGYEFQRAFGRQLWQTRYYEHILRRGDHTEDVACYVWWNPVRAGLCADPREYPLSGSQTIDWMKFAGEATSWRPPWKAQDDKGARVPG